MSIDWSKAPDWAIAHGLKKAFWLGETQYQNLEHPQSFQYGGVDPSIGSSHNDRRGSFIYVTPRPAPWTGEGLPPVGTVCEYSVYGHGDCWKKGEVIAHHHAETVFCAELPGVLSGDSGGAYLGRPVGLIRPICTPEQIAAEEREKASVELAGILSGHDQHIAVRDIEMAKYLYDAGYRKQVAP